MRTAYHFLRERNLVPSGQLVVQGHDNAVGDDGEDDGPLEDGPVHEPHGQAPGRARRGEDEERGGPRLLLARAISLVGARRRRRPVHR